MLSKRTVFSFRGRAAAALGVVTLVLAYGGCSMPSSSLDSSSGRSRANPEPIVVESESFTLAWEAPNGAVDHYEVYYRERDASGWKALGTTNGSTATFRVDDEVLDNGGGSYVFAVRSITPDGNTSPLHTSLSSDAEPSSGWYVRWEPEL